MKKFLNLISILTLTYLLTPAAIAAPNFSRCPTASEIKQVGVDQVEFKGKDYFEWVAFKDHAPLRSREKNGDWSIDVFPFADQGAAKILSKANEALANLKFDRDEWAPGWFQCRYSTTSEGKNLRVWATYTWDWQNLSMMHKKI